MNSGDKIEHAWNKTKEIHQKLNSFESVVWAYYFGDSLVDKDNLIADIRRLKDDIEEILEIKGGVEEYDKKQMERFKY